MHTTDVTETEPSNIGQSYLLAQQPENFLFASITDEL